MTSSDFLTELVSKVIEKHGIITFSVRKETGMYDVAASDGATAHSFNFTSCLILLLAEEKIK
jgi:hypothetical protein